MRKGVVHVIWVGTLLLAACGDQEASTSQAEPAGESPENVPEEMEAQAAVEPCADLRVTIDGEAVELGHAIGASKDGGLEVHLFNHDQVNCEEIQRGFWVSPADQIHVTARLSDGRGYVGVGNRTVNGVVENLDADGLVSLCVREEVSFPRRIGKPTATVVGLVSGRLCDSPAE